MGNGIDLKVSKKEVLEIYALYAEKCAYVAKSMQEDLEQYDGSGYCKDKTHAEEMVEYIDGIIRLKLEDLRLAGKELIAYKLEHALPLASISPSRLLKVLEVCGVQYDD